MKCNYCVNKNTEYCENCIDHPKWANRPKHSNYQPYKPVCPFGYIDCIYDPAYCLWSDSSYYKELYGDIAPEEAIKICCCCECRDGNCYDDEDK